MARRAVDTSSPWAQMPEDELLAAVIAKQPGAWAGFYKRYDRLIITCIRKVLHRYTALYGEEDLEDMASTVCLNLVKDDYHKLRAFDPTRGYKLSSWVGLIATNTAHDALRRREPIHQRIDAGHDADDDAPPVQFADREAPLPGDSLEAREEWEALAAAIRELSPSDQQFLSLYYEQELEPEEIAKRLGISVNTVYSRKNKVREKLRRIVDPSPGGTGGKTAASGA
jgi:RNA polymerase sigma-70 factor (ECF subfamily)